MRSGLRKAAHGCAWPEAAVEAGSKGARSDGGVVAVQRARPARCRVRLRDVGAPDLFSSTSAMLCSAHAALSFTSTCGADQVSHSCSSDSMTACSAQHATHSMQHATDNITACSTSQLQQRRTRSKTVDARGTSRWRGCALQRGTLRCSGTCAHRLRRRLRVRAVRGAARIACCGAALDGGVGD